LRATTGGPSTGDRLPTGTSMIFRGCDDPIRGAVLRRPCSSRALLRPRHFDHSSTFRRPLPPASTSSTSPIFAFTPRQTR
jgi:hypothetical protein